MGKVTGFKEFKRNIIKDRPIKLRIKDYDEIFGFNYDVADIKEQGARCMDCGVPFCQSNNGCPIDNLIPEWNDLVYKNKWQEALKLLHKTNNFPEFTGRVCPAPCESACVLSINNSAVAIKNIEQIIIDRGFDNGWVSPYVVSSRTNKKIAIIGSGPAGLAAADELNKMKHNISVFERDDRIGGLLMYGIPNMKLSKYIVNRRIDLLKKAGINFINNVNVGKDITTRELQEKFDAIIFATGATKARDLTIDNRDALGVHLAMEYLVDNTKNLLDNKNIKPHLNAKNKDVIVIGGGDTGADCIATALRQGAKSITNFEVMAKPPATRTNNNPWPLWPLIYRIDYAHAEVNKTSGNDPRQYCLMTKSFIKDGAGKLQGVTTINVETKDNKLIELKNSEKTWNTQLALLSIGFVSPEHYLSDDANIKLDDMFNYKSKYGDYQTSQTGIFSAGDCRRGQSLVVWAINEGRGVAKEVNKYLNK